MTRHDVLQILADHKDALSALGVEALYLFGSTARDKARPDSDVDVLIEIDHSRPFGLFALFEVQDYLQKILGQPVDLGTVGSIRPALREPILREAIRAA